MIRNREELLEEGYINEEGQFLRPLTFQALTGQESGVWFDYNSNDPFVKADNFADIEVVAEEPLTSGEYCFPWFDLLDCSETKATSAVQEYELEIIEGWGAAKKDIESLKDKDCKGLFFQIRIRHNNGDKSTICLFAPYDWN